MPDPGAGLHAAVSRRRAWSVSEWTKLRSVRSTRWSLLVATVLTIGFPILAAIRHRDTTGARASLRDRADFDPLDRRSSASQVAQLAIGVLGVLVISARVLDRDDPGLVHRRPEAAAGALGEGGRVRGRHVRADAPAVLIAFFASQAILSRHHASYSWSAPGRRRGRSSGPRST